MKIKLPKKLHTLKEGNMIIINGSFYTIKKKSQSKALQEHESNHTRYELGEGFVLEYDWDWKFFQCITKKRFLGFTTTNAKYIPIEKIEIVK